MSGTPFTVFKSSALLPTVQMDRKERKVKSLNRVQLFATPWTVAMGSSRQEYWSGLPLPSPDLPDPGIEPVSRIVGRYQGSPPAGRYKPDRVSATSHKRSLRTHRAGRLTGRVIHSQKHTIEFKVQQKTRG